VSLIELDASTAVHLAKRAVSRGRYSGLDCSTIILIDQFYLNSFGINDQEVAKARARDEVFTMMRGVNSIFQNNFDIGFPVTDVRFLSARTSDDFKRPSKNMGELLDRLRAELLSANAPTNPVTGIKEVCRIHLITHQDFAGTMGLAYVSNEESNAICNKNGFNVGITTTNFKGSKISMESFTEATQHEFGHTVGAIHDGSYKPVAGQPDPNLCTAGLSFVMAPTIDPTTKKDSLSPCAVAAIHRSLEKYSDCFVKRGTVKYLQFGGATNPQPGNNRPPLPAPAPALPSPAPAPQPAPPAAPVAPAPNPAPPVAPAAPPANPPPAPAPAPKPAPPAAPVAPAPKPASPVAPAAPPANPPRVPVPAPKPVVPPYQSVPVSNAAVSKPAQASGTSQDFQVNALSVDDRDQSNPSAQQQKGEDAPKYSLTVTPSSTGQSRSMDPDDPAYGKPIESNKPKPTDC
jgi:hypothetical protein